MVVRTPFGCIGIMGNNGIVERPVIDHAYLLQHWRLKLGIDDVHTNGRKQPLKFPISTN